MRRGAWSATLATGMLLALAIGAGPVLAADDFESVESDETRGPVTITGAPDETAAPLTRPTAVPPVATGSDLVAYEPEGQYTRRHWLDRPSIVIEDPYVRATVVVESSSGARTVSHFGFDCAERKLALIATGARDGSWRMVDPVDWRPVTQGRRQTPYLAAVYRAVCDGGGPTRTVARMIERLENPRGVDPY